MLIQPVSRQPELVRGTVVLLENHFIVWITEQHKRMEMISQQLYVPNRIEGYMHQRSQTLPQKKTPQTMIEPPCSCTVPTWHAQSMDS
ncbi:hypothetical protein TNCV_1036491 [Trichonephila clavipes]|nr:hypothetical protein TNCV_1036491 [Trichonephila clavipes]